MKQAEEEITYLQKKIFLIIMGGLFTGEINMGLCRGSRVSLSLSFLKWNKGPIVTNHPAHNRQPVRGFPPPATPCCLPSLSRANLCSNRNRCGQGMFCVWMFNKHMKYTWCNQGTYCVPKCVLYWTAHSRSWEAVRPWPISTWPQFCCEAWPGHYFPQCLPSRTEAPQRQGMRVTAFTIYYIHSAYSSAHTWWVVNKYLFEWMK